MHTSKSNRVRIESLRFDDKIYITLTSGDVLAIPRDYTPALKMATDEALKKYRLIADGIGVHFEEIDEDISLAGIIRYKTTHELMAS